VVIFGSIISYAYKQGSQSGVNATTPIVQASNDSYMEKPSNPGGMDVPFQDAIVFDQLQTDSQKTASADTIESLLPEAEQPVAKTEAKTDVKTETAKAETAKAETAKAETVTPTPETTELAPPVAAAPTTM